MKLSRFIRDGGRPEIGVVVGDRMIPAGLAPDVSMIELITTWSQRRPDVEAAIAAALNTVLLSDVTLLQPVQRPGKMMAIGLNYADHIVETGLEPPQHQLWFSKAATSAHPPFAPIELPTASTQLDYEVEMVAIIGKAGRHIAAEHAANHVFGYCVGNDVSVRDWQMQTSQWVLGKSFDTHGPSGPWITTADEVGDPHRLAIRAEVNGEQRQASNTRHLIFSVWDQIAHLSKAMTLEPGDIIFTGTPGGVGMGMNPPSFLVEGDVIRCEIERLGAIEAVVTTERFRLDEAAP